MNKEINKSYPDTSKSLPIAMLRAREAMMLSFRPVLAKHGFTEQQWRVLRVLGEKGDSDAGQVAFDACILAPSLSRIIGKLEKDQYISRFVDAKDGYGFAADFCNEDVLAINEKEMITELYKKSGQNVEPKIVFQAWE